MELTMDPTHNLQIMWCKPLGSSNVYTGRASPRWIVWPTHYCRNDSKTLQLQCAQLKGWKLFGQICLLGMLTNKFEDNVDDVVFCGMRPIVNG